MIFDTHAHYDSEQFDEDREELLASMQENGVGTIVNVSASYESCFRVPEMAKRYPFMYAAVGVHPDEVGDLSEENFRKMKGQFQNEKVVAVGEIGLDYYWDNEPRDVQKKWFIRQLELARELDLPVLIHSREAAADTMEIMKEHGQGLRGVIHCYSYSAEMAVEYVKMGYYIGVGGVVTFKNGRKLKETVLKIPLESIVLETDCPYMAPVPFRGKRNQSSYIQYMAQEIASLKGVSVEEVIAVTEANARNLYQIKGE
ncbi:MAG: TatD family hydrolase [Eubacteriales bacterium]|nr:TatD family hydrolase [Eubacteriales bacterium]